MRKSYFSTSFGALNGLVEYLQLKLALKLLYLNHNIPLIWN